MDMVSILVGAALGAVVGVIIGVVVLGKGKALEEANERLEKIRHDTTEQLGKLKANQGELRKDLETTRAKANKSAATATQTTQELAAMKAKLQGSETARAAAAKEAQSITAARDQAEGRAAQAEKLASDHAARSAQIEAELTQMRTQISEDRKLLAKQEAELTAARAGGSTDVAALFAPAKGAFDKILDVLLKSQRQTAAVLADTNGIVIAATGDKNLRDGIAAVAQMLTRFGTKFEGMIPFNVVQGFDLRDGESHVIAGRASTLSGEVVALATYGPQSPNADVLDAAMKNLTDALS